MRESMLAKLGDKAEMDEFKEKFIPEWSPGCRRLTPGEGYLETIANERHVDVVYGEIARFTEKGLVSASDGREREFDIIACATGKFVQDKVSVWLEECFGTSCYCTPNIPIWPPPEMVFRLFGFYF